MGLGINWNVTICTNSAAVVYYCDVVKEVQVVVHVQILSDFVIEVLGS